MHLSTTLPSHKTWTPILNNLLPAFDICRTFRKKPKMLKYAQFSKQFVDNNQQWRNTLVAVVKIFRANTETQIKEDKWEVCVDPNYKKHIWIRFSTDHKRQFFFYGRTDHNFFYGSTITDHKKQFFLWKDRSQLFSMEAQSQICLIFWKTMKKFPVIMQLIMTSLNMVPMR